MNNSNIKLVAILLLVILSGVSCTAKQNYVDYIIGFSTHEGNKIWVQEAIFDDSWSTPAGSLGCCWEEPKAASPVRRASLPDKIYIQWLDVKKNLVYKKEVKLQPQYGELALNLPEYTVKSSGRVVQPKIYLIIGMGKTGEVVVWLSNATSWRNKTGRVLHIIGQGQAVSEPWVK